MNRNLALTERQVENRTQQVEHHVVHFTLQEIKDRFDSSIRVIENKYTIYDQLISFEEIDEAKDILRSQIVFLESALDFFLHEMNKYSYFKMFSGDWNKTSQYRRFSVSMETVEKGLMAGDSKEWFFECVNDSFGRVVFLSFESIKEQLNSMGIPFIEVMHRVFLGENENASMKIAKQFIGELFQRRNAIAHQNDRDHASAQQNDIDVSYVKECVNTVKKIADEIIFIADSK